MGGGGLRRRRSTDAHDAEFTPSEDEEDYDVASPLAPRPGMQIVYKEKEDMLVQRALERIARARALAKPNVKLSRAEIDALERLERNQNPPRPSAAPKAAPKSKKEAPIKRKPVEVRKKPTSKNGTKSASNSPKGKAIEGRGRERSTASSHSGRDARDDALVSYALPPPELEYSHRPSYGQGYYVAGPRQAESSRQGSRSNSNPSLRQQQMQQMAVYPHPYYGSRYVSSPEAFYGARPGSNLPRAPRPDPSEPDWEPRTRSSSSLVNVPLDQLPYQADTGRAPRFDPADPRYASPQRRVASGPPAVHMSHAARARRPQDELFLPDDQPEVMRYLAPSDSEENDDDDDSDYDEGVQVDVTERAGGDYAIQTRSASASTSTHKAANDGRSRKGQKRR